jgi:hypothetical protein
MIYTIYTERIYFNNQSNYDITSGTVLASAEHVMSLTKSYA